MRPRYPLLTAANGMEMGVTEGYERLDELLARV
jgi:hypothetical protein